MKVAIVLAAIALSTPAMALTDEELGAVLDGFEGRRDQILQAQVEDPYPPDGVWHHADFALAALYLNQRVDEANEAILTIRRDFPVDLDPRPSAESPEVEDFHWYINILQRIYFLFHAGSDWFPGRLTPEAEEALREIFWESARNHCRIAFADPENTWRVWGSENHGAMSWSGFWATAHILADAPGWADRAYGDGSTPAQMARAWDDFFKTFARERAGKGLMVEIGSTYNRYTLQGWYNMADFAADPVLRDRMRMLLDLYWADWAIEQIDAVRGGARHRVYPGRTSTTGLFSSGQGNCWLYFGIGHARNQHPSHMCAATSAYRPPLVVADMALDLEGRGTYEYRSRRPGLNLLPKPDDAAWDTYALRPDFGGILRYSYCTPDFVMGTSMVESRPADDWSNISSQNRWDGVVFAGAQDSRIFVQPDKPERGSVYNSHWSVQKRGCLIIQKLAGHRHAHGQRIWFSADLTVTESGGWVIAQAPRAWAACRVLRGETTWEDAAADDGAAGRWLRCEDEFAPILIEVARGAHFASAEEFAAAVGEGELSVQPERITWRSAIHETTLDFFEGTARIAEVDGVPIDFAPALAYDSPFIRGEFGSGIVQLRKGRRALSLDFTAE